MFNRLLVKIGLKCSCGGWKRWRRSEVEIGVVTLDSGIKVAVKVAGRPCKRCGVAHIPEKEMIIDTIRQSIRHGSVTARM